MLVRKTFFLLVAILNLFYLSFSSVLFSNENNLEETDQELDILLGSNHQNLPPKRVAVCYWGLTRSVKQVYQTHDDNLFDQLILNGLEFDVFMHTWKMKGKQRVGTSEINTPIDYEEYKLLNPDFYHIDDQDEFTENMDFDQYFYQGVDNTGGYWPYDLVEKLTLNHVCALESLKRVTEMMELSGNHYDYVIYVRPDARLNNKFPAEDIYKLEDMNIILPCYDQHWGRNDRFTALNRQTAPIYGKRIDKLAEFKRSHGYIHAERYLLHTCEHEGLNVILIDFRFDLVRP